MRTSNFPLCCGARVITDWWAGGPDAAAKYLTRMEAAQKTAGLVTAILDNNQRKQYHKVMIEKGWKVFSEFTNPVHNHDQILTLYGKKLNQETSEQKAAREKKREDFKKRYGWYP